MAFRCAAFIVWTSAWGLTLPLPFLLGRSGFPAERVGDDEVADARRWALLGLFATQRVTHIKRRGLAAAQQGQRVLHDDKIT